MNILDQYETRIPSGQNVADLFANEWSCALPAHTGVKTTPGFAAVFDDPRIRWAESNFGGFSGRRVLELGPLEAAHTYMLSEAGASEIVSIEANSRAFLKCLCVKELLGINANFLLGDFVKYMETNESPFDIVIASGVLYHMVDPLGVLDLISRTADKVFLWTHYFDDPIIRANPVLTNKFSPLQDAIHRDFPYQYSVQAYDDALNWQGFCGGSETNSRWLPKNTIVDFLRKCGFDEVEIKFDSPEHPHGPSFAICAERRPRSR